MYAFEDITENMQDDGFAGKWLSVINGMTAYRVHHTDRALLVYDTDNKMVQDDEEVEEILRATNLYLKEN